MPMPSVGLASSGNTGGAGQAVDEAVPVVLVTRSGPRRLEMRCLRMRVIFLDGSWRGPDWMGSAGELLQWIKAAPCHDSARALRTLEAVFLAAGFHFVARKAVIALR